jgi:predicted AAA+ superfamily ATPase
MKRDVPGNTMNSYRRALQPLIEAALFKGRMIILYGARQVGKTTLVKDVLAKYGKNGLYLGCKDLPVRDSLTNPTVESLYDLVEEHSLLVVDDGQLVPNIGITLKMLAENFPEAQVIATGSLRLFDLVNDQNLVLTGGKTRFYLHPLSVSELTEGDWPLEKALIYGQYPGVIGSGDPQSVLQEIVNRDIYADVLAHEVIRGGDRLYGMLQALALRVGSEISFNELGDALELDKVTAARYVSLLEQANIIFHLRPFKRRQRKEINKLRKIYFYDLGVRNALIQNFNPLQLRRDVDELWQNFFISERVKYNREQQRFTGAYFWRTYDGTGLDYIEEKRDQLTVFQCSWQPRKWRIPASFVRTYPHSTLHLVHRENYREFL